MADRTVTIRLEAKDNLSPALKGASSASSSLATGLGRSRKASDELGASSGKTASLLQRIKPTAALAALGLGTLGVAAAFKGAYTSITTFDSALSAMRAYLTPTTAEFDQLRESALQMGKTTNFSASEAARSITELGKAGVSTKDIMGGGLIGALNLAAAGEMDVGEAAEAAAAAMAQFSLSGKDIPHIADLLAAGAGKAQGSVKHMTMALNQVGTVAATAGLSIEETVGGLTAFANAGMIGSDAGTSFKSMLQRLTPTSKTAQKEMERLGISAYDGQGKFIGLAKFSGVLQQALGGLSQEQRSSSMATIFGSDAVRAATILYKEGEAGVRKWTAAVEDDGYAAKVAAELTNNLAGDMRKFGNTLEAMMLSKSGGVVSFFRTFTQGATGLLGILDSLPGPVLSATAALAAFALLGPRIQLMGTSVAAGIGRAKAGLGGFAAAFRVANAELQSGVITGARRRYEELGDTTMAAGAKASLAAQRFRPLTSAVAGAATVMGTLKGAAGGLIGALGGPWGLAIAAAAAAVGYFAQQKAKAAAQSQALVSAVEADTQALGDNSAALGTNTRSVVVNRLEQDGMLAAAESLGISTRDYTDAILGNAEALARVNGVLDPYVEGVTAMAQVNGAAGFTLDENSQKAGVLKGTLTSLTGETKTAVEETQRKAAAMGQDAAATGEAGAAAEGMSGKTAAMTGSIKAAEAATKALDTALKALSGFLSADAAVTAYTGKLMEMTAASGAGSAAMDVQTKAGRAARSQMNDLVGAAQTVIKTMIDQGATSDQVTAKTNAMAAQIDAAGRKAGYSAAETGKYTAQLRAVPTSVTTKITADTSQAYSGVSNFIGWAQKQSVRIHAETGVRYNSGQFAHGGIVESYARGGIRDAEHYANGGVRREQHIAQIGRAGTWRVWAEDETGGEAYIPLAASKRMRSLAILEEVARRFGRTITAHADGALVPSYGRQRTTTRAEYAPSRRRGGQGEGAGVTMQITNNYPVAEPTSVTVNRALQHVAAIGL